MLYFRFDNKNEFKGSQHKSGFAGWYDICLDKFAEEYQDEYLELEGEKLDTRIFEYAEELGYILNGCSCFELTEEGLAEFINYIKDHPIDEYEEINIFEGLAKGFGHDGECVAQCTDIIFTGNTKDFMNIIDNEDLTTIDKLNKIKEMF